MEIARLEQVWPEWKIDSLLGEGSFGKVYKAVREEHGLTTYSAIKVVSIPQNEAELNTLRSEGMSEEATTNYFQGVVNDFVNEIKLMESMKGTQNIVSVEDYKVLERPDAIGWDILIRMELLMGFNDYIGDKKLAEEEVIKIGEDILTALELCSQRSIIHRDIKLENIFISSFGHFKLGDFGIARELEKTTGNMSQKGTYNYMAPEVAANRAYDGQLTLILWE
jgi:serine/threonine-protein kinase